MARRYYSSTAVATTLSALASNSTTSITVTTLTGYPNQEPWTAIIDPDTASEEVVEVTGVAGTTLTVTRGVDGTSAVQHSAGAVFRHGVSGRDFDEANEFINSTGVAKSVVNDSDSTTFRAAATDKTPLVVQGVASQSADLLVVEDSTGADLFKVASDGDVAAAGPVTISSSTQAVSVQVRSSGQASSIIASRASDNATGPIVGLQKYRGSIGSESAVQEGDTLGSVSFSGQHTAGFGTGASITASADGTPGSFQLPGRLVLSTSPSNNATPTERLRIDSDGRVKVNGGVLEAPLVSNARTDSYTLVLADAGKVVEMGKGTAQTLTVPPNSSVAFPVGTKIDVIQTGAGETTIAAGSGVTINSEGSKLKINAQWQAATLVKRATDSWVLIGAIKA